MILHVITIVRDGFPWLPCIFAELNRMGSPFVWHVVEGACANTHCSKWMQPQKFTLSADGTSQFIDSLAHDPRVRIFRKKNLWDGKIEMVNAPLQYIKEECVLLEVDSDELWSAEQFRQIGFLFEDDPSLTHARFDCRYFVGSSLITLDAGRDDEWLRAWRFKPGMRFVTHEPPNLAGNLGKSINRRETAAMGLRFDHYSWATLSQVEMKSKLYGAKYAGAVEGWKRMQAWNEFPARLKRFFPWASNDVMVGKV